MFKITLPIAVRPAASIVVDVEADALNSDGKVVDIDQLGAAVQEWWRTQKPETAEKVVLKLWLTINGWLQVTTTGRVVCREVRIQPVPGTVYKYTLEDRDG